MNENLYYAIVFELSVKKGRPNSIFASLLPLKKHG